MKRICKNCLFRENKICHNKHMQIGEPMGSEKCGGCNRDIYISDEGVPGVSEKTIAKVIKYSWLETESKFGCRHWKDNG